VEENGEEQDPQEREQRKTGETRTPQERWISSLVGA
jgi:hypothetical protein